MTDLILQLEDKRVLLLRVFTAVYGSSVPASGLKQVTLIDLYACRTCHFVRHVSEDRKVAYVSFLVTAKQLLTLSLMLLGFQTISQPICSAVWLLVQLRSRVKQLCKGAKDAS